MGLRGPVAKFRNIRTTNDGYQVTIVRGKIEISRFFAGHTKSSFAAAEKYREELLQQLPSKRLNNVPPHILTTLRLSRPVVGVFRNPQRKYYALIYLEEGRKRTRSFSWDKEEDELSAYRRAIAFRKKVLRDQAK